MTNKVKELMDVISELPTHKQNDLISLIEGEINWDESFENTQEELSLLASNALLEHEAGDSKESDWE